MSFKNTCSFLNGLICSLVSYLFHQNINFMRAETLFCLWYDPQNLVQLLSSVQISRSVMSDSVTPWIAARQASLSITNSRSSLRLMSIESVMLSSHLILCHPLLLLPPIPSSSRVFSNESILHMRWPKYWSFSFSIIPSKEIPGLISEWTGWIS